VFDLSKTNADAVASYELEPFFFYHQINAYDTEDGGIVVDTCGYPTANIVTGENGFLYLPRMLDKDLRRQQTRDGTLYRLHLPASGEASLKAMPMMRKDAPSDSDLSFELPRTSPQVQGRFYRYFYGYTGFANGNTPHADFTDWAVVKGEVTGGQVEMTMWSEELIYPSEPIFIPDPAGKDEDEGVVLLTAYDARREEGLLLWLNAQDMKEIGRAYCGIPYAMGFHGQFLPRS